MSMLFRRAESFPSETISVSPKSLALCAPGKQLLEAHIERLVQLTRHYWIYIFREKTIVQNREAAKLGQQKGAEKMLGRSENLMTKLGVGDNFLVPVERVS